MLVVVGHSCRTAPDRAAPELLSKVTFDLLQFSPDGLRGPEDGRRSLSYEFCIPNTPQHKAEVSAIDPSIQFMCGSAGRIGCAKDQCLCLGSTHQDGFMDVLRSLTELSYISRIDECFFE